MSAQCPKIEVGYRVGMLTVINRQISEKVDIQYGIAAVTAAEASIWTRAVCSAVP